MKYSAARLAANSGIDVSTTRRGPKRSTKKPCSGDIEHDHVGDDRERERRLARASSRTPARSAGCSRLIVSTAITLGPNASPTVEPSVVRIPGVVASELGLLVDSMLRCVPPGAVSRSQSPCAMRSRLGYGSAKTKSWLPLPGCSSGVRRAKPNARPEPPVLTATYCLPSTAKVTG